jgi:predicted O-linked N-acetylglucosamine transferase (SPINDLY family)
MQLSIDQAFQEGLAAHDEGRLQDAEFIYRAILEVQSAHPDANHNLGVLVVSAGKPIEALPFFTLALEASPGIEQFWLSYVDALLRAEWFEEAKQALADALQSGIPLEKLGVFHEQAAQASPKAHKKARQGLTLSEKRKRLAEKKKNKKKSVRDVSSAVGPSQDQVDLLLSFYQGNRFAEAEELARTLTQRFPSHPFAWKVLGAVLRQIGRQQESLKALQTCADLSPQDPEGRSNLGVILREIGKLDEAEASYRQALSLKPENAEAHNNLGTTLTDLGRLDEAEENLRHAITLKPDYAEARHNLLFVLNYDHRLSAADLYGQYAAYGEAVSELTKHCFAHNERTPIGGRRVRVGYSSPDFRGHACRFFMEPLFRNHDRDQFELFAYSNTLNPDQHTERMKGYFDHWVDVVGMTDEEMAQRIYDDQVDILVDMAGHTKGNRLPVFAMRPAPIQASSCTGYAYTTGLKEVDYFICDENMVPEGSECYFSEEPWRLPAPAEPYDPPREEAPDVSELPALRNGYVTFGSLTRTVRINDPLLRVWSEILERVPNSRLRLDQKPFAHEGTRELFWKRLEGLGLPRDRVDLTCSPSHWTAYHDIDITLDCWPHNAGTTTLESLWMGVPVLSKMDRPSVGRIGATVLKPLGLEDWLVETAEAYVEKAVSFASDLDALSELRAELRDRVDQGPHLDGATITGHLENAYRQMIRGARGGWM